MGSENRILRVHYHSDCSFFAGCENMLATFFGSPELRSLCGISFSYRASEAYVSGLHRRVNADFPCYPLSLPDASGFNLRLPGVPAVFSRLIVSMSRGLLRLPLFAYNLIILTRLFRRIRPDILHINNGNYPGALSCRAAAVAARLAGIRCIIMVVNNLAIPYTAQGRWLDYPVDRWVSRAVTRFVTGSRAAAVRLEQVLSLDAGAVVPLHNGIRLRDADETIAATHDRLGLEGFGGVLFGVVAIMEKRKGHRVLLEALEYLSRTNSPALSNIMVLMEGNGSLRGELEEFTRFRRLEDHVRFVGEEGNIFSFMQSLDVLILPSIENEDFPNVVLEGMALGKPVIASRLAGTQEQIEDGVTGFLTEPGDIVGVAEKMAELANNGELRTSMGRRASMRFMEHFTADVAVSRYLDLYRELTNRGEN